MTSTDIPTHFPGSITVDRDHPEKASIQLQSPATNTVRFKGSYLLIPVSGAGR